MRPASRRKGPGRPPAFTLVELLVVIVIIILVSAVALPTVIPALTSRQVSEGARILQAAIAGARDAAIRANAPRGIRLLPDLTLSPGATTAAGTIAPGQVLTASRIVPIEPAPDLTDSSTTGSATFRTAGFAWNAATPPVFPFPPVLPATMTRGTYPHPAIIVPPGGGTPTQVFKVLMVVQAVWQNNAGVIANPPTNWFWNVRIGDRFRFTDSGRYYTVVGPMTVANPENFVNDGPSDNNPFGPNFASLTDSYPNPVPAIPVNPRVTVHPEFLFLVNGLDDDGDGFVDDGLDGVNENANFDKITKAPIVDDIGEWTETETWQGSQAIAAMAAENSFNTPPTFKWTIARGPVPAPGAREVSMPGGATIDLTTWDSTHERSRLPVNPFNGTVDVLVNQAGQVIPTTFYSSPSSFTMAGSFFHFWVADRADVATPVTNSKSLYVYPSLPISSDALNVPATPDPPATPLKKDRVLITLFARTGQVVTNSIENFDYTDVNRPFDDAQLGIREAK